MIGTKENTDSSVENKRDNINLYLLKTVNECHHRLIKPNQEQK